MLWSTVYHRNHRYDVRAADREAIQVEQEFIKSYFKTTATPTNPTTTTTIHPYNFNVTKVSSKRKINKTKISSVN
ncbi:unnamed protein product [Brugia timori]|uniref:Uncharacterized protein n=1 Tax=Brugia timori TaxID=42155 RepID=A0A0R3R8N5_9BILA|nr:unnamed protein product [Brugia timori]